MDNVKELAKLICEATQKTNYDCDEVLKAMCKHKGCCAHCLTMAEYLAKNEVIINHIKE